jgi:hypothetical protein
MADFETVQKLADEAYNKALHFLNITEGWIPLGVQAGLSISAYPQEIDNVVKLEGSLNKAPQYAIQYLVDNIVRLRKDYEEIAVETEYIQEFPDNSRILRESSNYPGIGIIERYVYFSVRVVDGIIYTVAAPVGPPHYPLPAIGVNFLINKLTPTATGCDIISITQKTLTVELTNEQKAYLGQVNLKFYAAILAEIQA